MKSADAASYVLIWVFAVLSMVETTVAGLIDNIGKGGLCKFK